MAGVRGQSPLWRSPRPAEIGFAGRSSEDVGREAGDRTPPEGSAFWWIQAKRRRPGRRANMSVMPGTRSTTMAAR